MGDALWRRLYRGDVSRGWLRRSTGRDQPGPNGDHGTTGPGPRTGDHAGPDLVLDPDHEDQLVEITSTGEGPPSAFPDRPVRAETSWLDRDRRPLLPPSLQQPKDTAKIALKHAGFVAGFHLVRVPSYLFWNLAWSPRGFGRTAVGLVRWSRAAEYREDEWHAAKSARVTHDWNSYRQTVWMREAKAKTRTMLTVPVVLGTIGLVLVGLGDWTTMVPTVLALVLGFGWMGRPMDRPYIESAVVSVPGAKRITPDMVVKALYAAKLCKEMTGPDAPEFVGGRWGRDGDGWGGVVDLPYGFKADDAIKRKTDLAAGLRVDEFRLFVDRVRGDRGHAGQVKLWIADSDPHTRTPATSPLVKMPSFDLWSEVPFGRDERGRLVSFPLIWTSVLIGALPRMGKTSALRLLLAAVALDPFARMLLWDGKGGKDHAPFEQVAHAFGAGPDDEVAKALVAALRDLVEDMRRRYAKMRRLPDDVCPEAKVTRALARDPKMGMPLTVVAIDEFQVYLEHKRYGGEILDLLTTLAKVGPGAGIILVLATQRPSSTVMKTDFRDVIGTRFAMRVTTREFSEMILGSGSYKAGLDASRFLDTHKGVGILLGADDGELVDKGGQTVHTHIMDLPQLTAVCKRARALREGAGTLTGVAAGEDNEALSDRVLEHVAKAFRGDPKAHSDVLCARMAEDHPGLYADWDQTDLAVALRRYGIEAGNQTWAPSLEDETKRNRKGFDREHVIDAVARRTAEIPDEPPDFGPETPD